MCTVRVCCPLHAATLTQRPVMLLLCNYVILCNHLYFCSRGSWHLFRYFAQVNPPGEVHLPRMDTQNIQPGLGRNDNNNYARIKLIIIILLDLKSHLTYYRHMPGRTAITGSLVLTSSLGGGNSIFLSMRPGRKRAMSNMSILLVAMTTLMFCVASKPSNWLSSSSIVRCTSLSATVHTI